MINLSNIAHRIPNSPIRKMFNLANSMENTINFSIGEPDFDTPKNIVDAAVQALKEGRTHYTLNAGISPLREAISKKVKVDYGLNVSPEHEVIVTAGGMEALILCMMVLINRGDEVIITDPCWPNYPNQIIMCGGTPKFIKVFERDCFQYNIEDLKKAISKNTKAILINSPANPTGGVADEPVLKEISDVAIENNLIVISDEVYRHFIYDGCEFTSISTLNGMKERTVIVDSFSKSYAMTGWRIGYAIGPQEIIKNMVKFQENVVACVNTPAQYAAIEALEGTQEPLQSMIAKYDERRSLIVEEINRIDKLSCVTPKGAFYVFVNISKLGLSSEEFALGLLNDAGVVVVPGSGFGEGGEGYVRISYATSEENIIEGLKRIEQYVKSIS